MLTRLVVASKAELTTSLVPVPDILQRLVDHPGHYTPVMPWLALERVRQEQGQSRSIVIIQHEVGRGPPRSRFHWPQARFKYHGAEDGGAHVEQLRGAEPAPDVALLRVGDLRRSCL